MIPTAEKYIILFWLNIHSKCFGVIEILYYYTVQSFLGGYAAVEVAQCFLYLIRYCFIFLHIFVCFFICVFGFALV